MISLLIVGDGERDAVTLPRLVERILNVEVQEDTRHWKDIRLNRGTGYARKLLFALRQAQDMSATGLIAVVDTDADRERLRLREMREARDQERTRNPPFPTALGQAAPHGEAWLLDDPVAVRRVLILAADVAIENVRRTKNPKDVLESLIRACERSQDDLLELFAAIAGSVAPERCVHGDETGFRDFVAEVQAELGPAVERSRSRAETE